jgi:type II secretory pathway pseudopilin PulG
MTLIEIMVATGIFIIVGGAMVGIFATSVSLYQAGEKSRAASDEAMAVIGRLDADLSRIIAGRQGGRIYTKALSDANGNPNGMSVLGFLAERSDAPGQREFILWGPAPNGDIFELRRKVLQDGDGDGDFDDVDLNDAFARFDDFVGQGELVSDGAIHFGVWLAGTNAADATRNYTVPDDPYWLQADPNVGGHLDPSIGYQDEDSYNNIPDVAGSITESPFTFPEAIRCTFILGSRGGEDTSQRLRLRQAISPGERAIPVMGTGAVRSLPGSICRIGSELIAFHAAPGKVLQVNTYDTDFSTGPVAWNLTGGYDDGRGVYRSTPSDHSRGAFIYFGQQFALVRNLP